MGKDFDAALARLTKKLVNDIPKKAEAAVRAAMENSANEIVAEMKRFVPVDTGDLQMSIGWCWGNAPKGTMTLVRGGIKNRRTAKAFKQNGVNDKNRISIYAGGGEEYYAWMVEFGSRNIPAHPFFYPVWRARKKSAKARVTRAVSRAVKEAAK